MKYFIILFNLFLIISIDSNCQKKAVIKDSGKEVELFDDGTWKYVITDLSGSIKIDTVILNKLRESDYLIKSAKLKYGIWINKKKWAYEKNKDEEVTPTEYSFRLLGQDAYGMIISERIEIPVDNLLDIAFQNAQQAAPDIKLITKELRQINGNLVYFMQMEGTIQGVKFVYLGYYYSDKDGSIQFLTYTSQNMLKQYKAEMETLLNGFVINR